jgi:Na+/H+ antiporter NhaD/arsenite permease-like protein
MLILKEGDYLKYLLDPMLIASFIFIFIYVLIVFEKIERTIAALLGAVIMIGLGFIAQEEAIKAIDFNTLGLLIGMMAIVEITKHTGLFEYLAFKAAKLAKGDPMRIMIALSIITALASALLDNVTTVLLIVPVTFSVTNALRVKVFPFLMAEILAANIGGTATLIGDPPNIMIGAKVGLTFNDFLVNTGPIVIVIQIVTSALFYFMYRRKIHVQEEDRLKVIKFNEQEAIKDSHLLKKCLAVLGLVILGFLTHNVHHIEPSTLAIGGAVILMLWGNLKPEKILHHLEWGVIFFFVGLFILVGTLEHLGVIELIAKEALALTKGDLLLTGMLILWLSAIASAFIDNIPFVATMIPLITSMGELGNIDIGPLWWALSLGACLGGNGTIIGASANVVVAGMAEERGHHITFSKYFKVAFPLMLVSIVIATIYMYFRYLS